MDGDAGATTSIPIRRAGPAYCTTVGRTPANARLLRVREHIDALGAYGAPGRDIVKRQTSAQNLATQACQRGDQLAQTITLHLPEDLYHRLKQSAEQRQRSIEEEVLDVVASAVPQADVDLPNNLAGELAQLSVLGDDALWRAARSHLSAKIAQRLESLHLRRQSQGLTEAEGAELAGLVRQYERALLVRAQAAAILARRGHDVSGLIRQP